MRQPSRKTVGDLHAILVQGDSVRMTWGIDEPRETPSIKRQANLSDPPPTPPTITNNQLRLRLAEELDYAGRMLDLLGRELAADAPIMSVTAVSFSRSTSSGRQSAISLP